MSARSQTKIAKRHCLILVLTGSGSAIFSPTGSGLTERRKVRHSISTSTIPLGPVPSTTGCPLAIVQWLLPTL
jgi:hypothetical protein